MKLYFTTYVCPKEMLRFCSQALWCLAYPCCSWCLWWICSLALSCCSRYLNWALTIWQVDSYELFAVTLSVKNVECDFETHLIFLVLISNRHTCISGWSSCVDLSCLTLSSSLRKQRMETRTISGKDLHGNRLSLLFELHVILYVNRGWNKDMKSFVHKNLSCCKQ